MTMEKTLFAAADKMRGSMDPGEYKHVALGLLFLRYIGVAFQRKYDEFFPKVGKLPKKSTNTSQAASSGYPRLPAGAGCPRMPRTPVLA